VSPVARVGGVALSVAAHVGVGALLLTLSVADWSRPLFVDLVERAEAPGGTAAGLRGASGTQSPRSGPTGSPTSRATEAPKGAARAIPSATPPPALMPQATPPPAAPVPIAEPAPTPPTPPSSPSLPAVADLPIIPMFPEPPSSSGPVALGTPGTAAAPAPGAGSRSGGEAPGEGATSGPALALGTPGPGAGAIPAEYGPYLQRFRQRVQESLVYPLAARRQGLRGSVELDVWLDPAGRVRDVRVARSSSHGLLDDAAIETVRHLGPLPFPESLPRRALLIRLPLVFDLR
jgi:periplasmic protein TonB